MEAHVPNEFLCFPNFKTNPNAWGIWFQLVLMARANKGKGEHWFKKPGEMIEYGDIMFVYIIVMVKY